MATGRPKMAIIDPNTLAVMGLRSMLQEVMPIISVDYFSSFDELMDNAPEQYFHYFVAMNIVLGNLAFFQERQRKTIVLIASDHSLMSNFHCLCINVPEKELVKSLLAMVQGAHPHGKNMPSMPQVLQKKILSNRELEVLSLIVQGYINKEIADKLNIGLATVITHRRNIMDKLGVKSVSALTIYAVMHGYVDISKI
ncbi:MAG: response regulator transcription factor [Prevotella sp.]|nr:response regulator transcription factor [Prevotella sp.]MBR1464071.1 response regulator transcription factor [Prevotella sp.]